MRPQLGIVGVPGLEPRTSASETDVLTNYTHTPIFVGPPGNDPGLLPYQGSILTS